MVRVLLQTFRAGRSVYDNYPRSEQELIELQVPQGYECILIHKVASDTVNVCLNNTYNTLFHRWHFLCHKGF